MAPRTRRILRRSDQHGAPRLLLGEPAAAEPVVRPGHDHRRPVRARHRERGWERWTSAAGTRGRSRSTPSAMPAASCRAPSPSRSRRASPSAARSTASISAASGRCSSGTARIRTTSTAPSYATLFVEDVGPGGTGDLVAVNSYSNTAPFGCLAAQEYPGVEILSGDVQVPVTPATPGPSRRCRRDQPERRPGDDHRVRDERSAAGGLGLHVPRRTRSTSRRPAASTATPLTLAFTVDASLLASIDPDLTADTADRLPRRRPRRRVHRHRRPTTRPPPTRASACARP